MPELVAHQESLSGLVVEETVYVGREVDLSRSNDSSIVMAAVGWYGQ